MREHRGSQRHVLDWASHPAFLDEVRRLVSPASVVLDDRSDFMPRPPSDVEARLESFGPRCVPASGAWSALEDWWLVHRRGANTPNWDAALCCELEGRPGLVLFEAKAHRSELSPAGKRYPTTANGRDNHLRIESAVSEARAAWQRVDPKVEIGIDSHYQLVNRLAFAWKLATLRVPVVLVYLGFIGDTGMAGGPFLNAEDWQDAFCDYTDEVGAFGLFEQRHEFSSTPVWLLSRSRVVDAPSPAPAS